MRRPLALVVLACAALLGSPGSAAAHHGYDKNCDDFRYYEDALAHLRAHPGDPDRLDTDGDGRPCESLPRRPSAPPPPPPPPPADPCVEGAIDRHYRELGGARGFLGRPTTCQRATSPQYGRYNHFEGGSIYWSPDSGAWSVRGAIRSRWAALGREDSPLGFPITDERRSRTRPGSYGHFQGGSIFWSPDHGAHEVRGAIRKRWAALGWQNSVLGYPTAGERATSGRAGSYGRFEGGSVYWSSSTGAWEVRGAIGRLWTSLGAQTSPLGFPTSGERATPGGSGAYSTFEGGSVYWSSATGAQPVRGAIRSRWLQLGGPSSVLGLPTGAERTDGSAQRQDFQRGSVVWSSFTGAQPLRGAIRSHWLQLGGTGSWLGLPTGDEYTDGVTQRQDFQGGHVTWTAEQGAVAHPLPEEPETGTAITAAGLLAELPLAEEGLEPYDRELFRHWTDADGDGCDTRAEVLLAETLTAPTVDPATCYVSAGLWHSSYDGQEWTDAADVDVDHVVALSEAWDSGASGWSAAEREDFANDLAYGASLAAVTDGVNASKSDADPAEWLPPDPAVWCDYATDWTAVKYRWRLTVDPGERDAVANVLSGDCGARTLTLPPRGR